MKVVTIEVFDPFVWVDGNHNIIRVRVYKQNTSAGRSVTAMVK